MRRPALLAVLSLCSAGLTAIPLTASAGTLTTISSSALQVSVDSAFPRVASYTDVAGGSVLYGDEDTLSQVVLNGTTYTPTVTSTVASDHVDYTMTFGSYGDVAIDATLSVAGKVLGFEVTRIADTTANPANSLSIPGHNLVSIRSSQSGAALAWAK
ncbi:MAG TPA: hypothetical protein VEK80_02770, partial [Kribbellaceae bacterium]|nr:hypothetical protein [Kribbellaceae bacterium]